jgi:hypothetical protein
MGSNSCHKSSVRVLSRFLFILVFIFFGMQKNVFAQAVENVFKSKTCDAGISAGICGGGSLSMDMTDYDVNKKTGFLIKGYYDAYLIPQLACGAYVSYFLAPANISYTKSTITPVYLGNGQYQYVSTETNYSYDFHNQAIEIGGSIKPRFFIGSNWAVKPGLNMGYRRVYFNESDLDAAGFLQYFNSKHKKAVADGMGVNLSVEAQYSYSQDMSLYVEAGFLTQPFGGTLNVTTLQFGPILYFTIGAAL